MALRTGSTRFSVACLSSFSTRSKRVAQSCLLALLFAGQAHAQGSFTSTGQLNTARFDHTATLLNNGKVLIAGGCDVGGNVYYSAELYDPSNGTFSATGNLNAMRCDHTETLLQSGKVLIEGGYGGSGILSSAELYDPSTGSFSSSGSVNTTRVYDTATLLQNGLVLLAGGNSNGGTGYLSSAELFDPSTGTFTATGSMTTAREFHSATILQNGQVLIEGGMNGTGLLSSAELYDPSTGTFTATGNMTSVRFFAPTTLLHNGLALIAGGETYLTSADLYNPSTNTFTATGSLNTARMYHTATELQDGKVLIAGGANNSGILSSAELFDPSTGTFTAIGNMTAARFHNTATLLQNGLVLIVGGESAYSGAALNSAELYDPGVYAVTYYISYSSGSNSNNGTSKSTPWKTHPYMQAASACTGTGSTPSYTHSAGDTFIFKQGDSWPKACFDMVIQQGGSSTNPDQYTFDYTWGVVPGGAGATTGSRGQTVGTYQFNAGGSVINGSDGFNDFIYDNGNNYITFNGLELTGMFWNAASPGSYGNEFMIQIQESTNVIVSNLWAHGWTYSNPTSGGDDLAVMVGNGNSPYNSGSRLTGSVIDGLNSGGSGASNSGAATFAIPLCDNNIIRNVTNGCLLNANGVAYNNLIGPVNQSFDTSTHENCIEPIDTVSGGTSTVYIYNNVIHDCTAVGILTEGGASSSSNEIDYLWNNVYYVGSVSSPPIPFQFDTTLDPPTDSAIHAWNNTIYAGSGTYCMRLVNRGNGNIGTLDLENNHCITGQGLITIDSGVSANSYSNTTNLTMSLATASSQGYTSSETYAYSPTAASNSTVGAGTNLTSIITAPSASLANDTTYGGLMATNERPATGAWDIGAYEY